jgi:hypothetical protein
VIEKWKIKVTRTLGGVDNSKMKEKKLVKITGGGEKLKTEMKLLTGKD